jgi:hypothetical protein
LVLNQERNYCSNCYYIIGVVTHEQKTEYSLLIEVFDANYENSQLMKIGEVYESTIKNKEQKLYRFIVDDST